MDNQTIVHGALAITLFYSIAVVWSGVLLHSSMTKSLTQSNQSLRHIYSVHDTVDECRYSLRIVLIPGVNIVFIAFFYAQLFRKMWYSFRPHF